MNKLSFIKFLVLAFFMPIVVSCGSAQSAAEKEAAALKVRDGVENMDFVFKARYAYPTGYKSLYLSPYYDVKVNKDTVVAYLPYYGRAYSAPMDPREGGIKFTSTDFDYKLEPGKKAGNWKLDIRINDTPRDVNMFFDIWEGGTSRLTVSDSNRQTISFSGDIETKQDK